MFWSLILDQTMNRLSEPTTAVHTCSSDWLHLDIFPPMEDALPWTTRIFDTWKTSDQYCHEQQSAFWPFLLDQNMSKHVLDTFWAHYADRTAAGHLSTYERCSTADHKNVPHLVNQFWHKCQSLWSMSKPAQCLCGASSSSLVCEWIAAWLKDK